VDEVQEPAQRERPHARGRALLHLRSAGAAAVVAAAVWRARRRCPCGSRSSSRLNAWAGGCGRGNCRCRLSSRWSRSLFLGCSGLLVLRLRLPAAAGLPCCILCETQNNEYESHFHPEHGDFSLLQSLNACLRGIDGSIAGKRRKNAFSHFLFSEISD